MTLLSALKYLLLVLIGGVIVYLVMRKRDVDREDVLQQNDKQHQRTIERMQQTIDSLLLRDVTWSSDYLLVKDSLKAQRHRTNFFFNEYWKLKNAPAVHYSDAALDSVVFALTDRYAQD